MCDYLEPIEAKKVKGYKVVMERNGERYSPATGVKYHSGRLVRVPKKQVKLTNKFNSGILDPKAERGFRQDMVGRTAAFKLMGDASHLAEGITAVGVAEGYTASVHLVRLSNGLMKGRYKYDAPVYAGRRMTFIKKESF